MLAITQSPTWVTEGSAITVNLELADASHVNFIVYTFCQLTSPNCYFPAITMSANGSNWFTGTTKPMSGYPGMNVGVSAGYNISINYTNGTIIYEPQSASQSFPGLTVAQSIVNENLFEVTVRNPVYTVSGTVTDVTTGAPIADAGVSLWTGSLAGGQIAANGSYSDASGAFSFPGQFNGSYTLSVVAHGYWTVNDSITVSGGDVAKAVAMTNHSLAQPPPPGSGSAKGGLFGLGATATTELYAALIVLALVVIVGALLLVRRRRQGGAPPPPAS